MRTRVIVHLSNHDEPLCISYVMRFVRAKTIHVIITIYFIHLLGQWRKLKSKGIAFMTPEKLYQGRKSIVLQPRELPCYPAILQLSLKSIFRYGYQLIFYTLKWFSLNCSVGQVWLNYFLYFNECNQLKICYKQNSYLLREVGICMFTSDLNTFSFRYVANLTMSQFR